MALKELEIISVGEILEENLEIPYYQRPYKWSKETTLTLFNDIKEAAYRRKVADYRIGTVILHKDKEGKYNIVDGQQRITTLCILKYCLGEKSKLLEKQYSTLSQEAISRNYRLLKQKVEELEEQYNGYKKYLLENCTIVKLVIDNEQEAFQFFDSQNARGKSLYPHDLLKAYHLREMRKENKKEKEKIIDEWQNIEEEGLEILFSKKLFPIKQWYRGKSGLDYSSKKIGIFKGIKSEMTYNYVNYHKKADNFQLTQPLIAGKGFFQYILHYYNLLQEVESLIQKEISEEYKEFYQKRGKGYQYTKNLFINAILLFVDRFEKESLTKSRLDIFFKWAYSLRIVMQSILVETINNYAIGKESVRINKGLNIFEKISEMKKPEELEMLELKEIAKEQYKLSEDRNKLYNCIYGKSGGSNE